MKKKEIIKYLVDTYQAKKARFKEYDVSFVKDGEEYMVKIFNTNSSNQVTINSTIIWGIQNGKVDRSRYKTTSRRLIEMKEFQKHKNKIVLFTDKPFKVLKYLNESDLRDITDLREVHGIRYYYEVSEMSANL